MRLTSFIIFCLLLPFCLHAQTGSRPLNLDFSSTNSLISTNMPAKPPVRMISAGVYEVGIVQLDNKKRSVSFPAKVNMRDGIVEYWLVNTGGKVHESILSTEAQPYHVHIAMLLIGAKGRPNLTSRERVEDKNVVGDTVNVWVEWTDEKGEKVKKRAEELVNDTSTKAVMTKGTWIYNGSWIFNGAFVAQRELSIVSTILDHDALINNPRPKREDDDNWTVNTAVLPPKDTPVTVTIELIKPYAKPESNETKP